MKRLLAAAAFCTIIGCNREPASPPEPMDHEAFIRIMVALRQADQSHPTEAAFDDQKAAILRAEGVTDSTLMAYVRFHAGDIDFMAALWDTINARLAAGADSARIPQ